MRPDAIYNVEGGYYEAPSFARKSANIKLDITKCIIHFNRFGFIYLMLDGKELKKLNFQEYLRYRNYVLKIDYEGV